MGGQENDPQMEIPTILPTETRGLSAPLQPPCSLSISGLHKPNKQVFNTLLCYPNTLLRGSKHPLLTQMS